MPLSFEQLAELPSPFYRVAAKAIIKDDQDRMLMVFSKDGNPEVPGGGWEHGETFEECLRREVMEELGVELKVIGPLWFTYQSVSKRGWHVLRLVATAELASTDFPVGEDMSEARWVSKDELLQLEYSDNADDAIRGCVDKIWSK